MKEDDFLRKFNTCNPSIWSNKSCDPTFTDMNHLCRGLPPACKKQNIDPATNRPSAESCWRFTLRFHQEESRDTDGFIIQVEELQGLGAGQKIESEIARQVGVKVFRTYTNIPKLVDDSIARISEAVQAWYASGCVNRELQNVFIGFEVPGRIPRPNYQAL